jgi:hypothetical protein
LPFGLNLHDPGKSDNHGTQDRSDSALAGQTPAPIIYTKAADLILGSIAN